MHIRETNIVRQTNNNFSFTSNVYSSFTNSLSFANKNIPNLLGTVIDSYENYPDNEMWAKSEYKIIDMQKIIPARERIHRFGNVISISRGRAKPFTYAPFLYMKNQTTGVYHLEGIHPRCKTLYDAIKMRYKGLNIKAFEIKDIK